MIGRPGGRRVLGAQLRRIRLGLTKLVGGRHQGKLVGVAIGVLLHAGQGRVVDPADHLRGVHGDAAVVPGLGKGGIHGQPAVLQRADGHLHGNGGALFVARRILRAKGVRAAVGDGEGTGDGAGGGAGGRVDVAAVDADALNARLTGLALGDGVANGVAPALRGGDIG